MTVQCKAKNGWQSCRYHGSGFSQMRVSALTAPLKDKTSARYTKMLRFSLTTPGPESEYAKNNLRKIKETAGMYQLLHDCTPEGRIELEELLKISREERNATFRDQVHERILNAEYFNSSLDVEEKILEKFRTQANTSATEKFGDIKSVEAKTYRDQIFKNLVVETYKTNPRIKPIETNVPGAGWDTTVANKALLECVTQTLNKLN